jgi:hypothetical protein
MESGGAVGMEVVGGQRGWKRWGGSGDAKGKGAVRMEKGVGQWDEKGGGHGLLGGRCSNTKANIVALAT